MVIDIVTSPVDGFETVSPCATIFTIIAAVHIIASGLYGVVFTDVIQGG